MTLGTWLQPPARSLDSPGQTGPQLLSCCPTLEERTSPPDNFKKITDMSWIFLSSDMIWILRYNCCVNSNIRQRQLQLHTSPLWIELSRNPFPYRPELARIRRNVRTLGKDHSSSVVRIPTHEDHISPGSLVTENSHKLSSLSSALKVSVMRTQGLKKSPAWHGLSPTLLFQLSNSIKYFLTVKIENINQGRIWSRCWCCSIAEAPIVRFKYLF